MAILEIIEAPHPVLTQKARPVRVDALGADLERRLLDMAETMYAAPGVGLAAPQVSDSRRMLVMDPGYEDDEGTTHKGRDLLMMVNPLIVERGRETILWEESCLSVPDMYVDVKRSKKVFVRWQTPHGEVQERWFEEFPAVVVQHEIDHLDGKTLYERASRLKRSRYLARRKKMKTPEHGLAL